MMTVMPFVLSCCVDELYSYSLLSRTGRTGRETTSVMSEGETELEMVM
jgi:hypothetical protein